jgi:exodeoxyribonuclease VII small subunit
MDGMRMNEAAAEKMKFEDALAELERIVRELEDGQTGLEQSLARYEQGVALLRRCYQQLQQAEQRILVLTGQTEDGAPVLKPFAHAATGDSKPKKDTLPLWKREGED